MAAKYSLVYSIANAVNAIPAFSPSLPPKTAPAAVPYPGTTDPATAPVPAPAAVEPTTISTP